MNTSSCLFDCLGLITIHKSQGLTLKKASIDLGSTEKAAGLAYVVLSRVKSLNDLVVEPMTLERLHAIKNCVNYKYRIKEEQRLSDLSKRTCKSYKL